MEDIQLVTFHQPPGPSLYVERYDAGSPACVLIHGGGDGAFVWDQFVPVPAQRFTSLVVDLRGHGNSGWTPPSEYKCDAYVSDVAHVIDNSNVGDLILIGHSLGAEVAIHLCAHYRDWVRACVLVDFAPELNVSGMDRVRSLIRESLRHYDDIDQYVDWLMQTRLLTPRPTLRRLAERALRPDDSGFRLKIDPELVDSMKNPTMASTETLWTLLRRQSCPTLVVRGSGSAVLSRAVAKRVAETIPYGELDTVEAAGHSVMADNPEGFERVVMAFLDRTLSFSAPHAENKI